MRLLARQLLTGIYREIATDAVFESERAFDVAKGTLINRDGIGQPLISRVLKDMPGMTENGIRESLSRLKASGDYARTLRGMTDIEMFRIMGMENSEDWMNPVHHTEQVIKQGRAFFDSWLDRFPTWPDFSQSVLQNRLAEFGPSRETAIQQVTEWLGGAAEAPNHYAKMVKYGVGAETLHRFTGVREATIKAALTAFPPFPPGPMGGVKPAEIVQILHILVVKLYTEPLKIFVQAGLVKTERPESRILSDNR